MTRLRLVASAIVAVLLAGCHGQSGGGTETADYDVYVTLNLPSSSIDVELHGDVPPAGACAFDRGLAGRGVNAAGTAIELSYGPFSCLIVSRNRETVFSFGIVYSAETPLPVCPNQQAECELSQDEIGIMLTGEASRFKFHFLLVPDVIGSS